jgi:excisionase family DNA binding protein
MSSHQHDALPGGQPAFMRVPEVARWLDISATLTKRLLRTGRLPGVKFGKVWRVERKALADYLQRLSAEAERQRAARKAS